MLLCSLCPVWITEYRVIMITVVLITLIKLPRALTKHHIFWLWNWPHGIFSLPQKGKVRREHKSFDFNHKSPQQHKWHLLSCRERNSLINNFTLFILNLLIFNMFPKNLFCLYYSSWLNPKSVSGFKDVGLFYLILAESF